MEKAKEIYQYILGAIVTLGFFTAIYIAFTKEMPSPNKELLLMLIGALTAKFGDIVSYFFGSSKSSADKTKMMGK